jgi:IS5 family transposase
MDQPVLDAADTRNVLGLDSTATRRRWGPAAVNADKGYESKARRRRLKALGIKDHIMHRAHKYQPVLPRWQARRNALIARIRAPVERIFGAFKRLHGRARAHYCNFLHNLADFYRLATVYNLRRATAVGAA